MEETSLLSYLAITFFSLHCLITSCMAAPNITTDHSALAALKSFISHDPKNVISRNWSDSSPVCSWIGIICSSRHQRVIALNISYMNLQGIIPPELGNLSFLMSLDMRNNSFHDSLSQEFANLRRLKWINLSNNNLSGSIPSVFSTLPNLRFLSLSGNKFSGFIPNSIANASTLEELDLNGNFLEGNIPWEINNLSNLISLNLGSNRLTGPVSMLTFNLSALEDLRLSFNDLSGKLSESFCDYLPKLKSLYLSENVFDGRIPSSLQKCEHLQVLSLGYNKFTGSIPREIGNLTRLRTLVLGSNNLEGEIPKEIGNLEKLERFGLNWGGMSGLIPAGIFNISTLEIFSVVGNNLSGKLPSGFILPNLQRLYLGGNILSGFIPDSISNASKLTILDFSVNSFTGPIPNSLGHLEFLETLSENKFVSASSTSEHSFLTSLTNCRHLKELALGNNSLVGKLPTSIGNFSSLELFSAYKCKIQGTVPQQIGNISTLQFLSLSSNDLIGSIPTTITGLQKLQRMYFAINKITGSIPDEICSLQNLGLLSLYENQISGALPACLGNITSLRNLYLASNRLDSSLPASIWRLNDILEFNASSNMLTGNLPLEIGNWKVATLVDLSMNSFSGNIPTTIGDLQSLIYLLLANNKMEQSMPESFGRILSLEYLDLSHNSLTGEIPKSIEALSYLTYFNASFNDLSGEIPSGGPFKNFTKQSFMHNKALCGASKFQVPPCHFTSPSKTRKKKRVINIALCTIFSSVAVTIVLAGLLLLRCQKIRQAKEDSPPQVVSQERISYDELLEATEGFGESNILGTGGFSSVYKGRLRDGLQVAVKVFNIQLEDAFRSFDTECEVLRNLRHRNLTKVISSCTNLEFRALVLEYMPNGSLEKWLYSHNYFLDLLQRLNIVIDVAYALYYLHNGYLVPVVHCDLKPSNVLLDNELVGHVSDFGISKILGQGDDIARTKTFATIGYIAPEYGLEGLVSTKSDIYSYGILLMETFSRTKPSDNMFCEQLSLKQWIKDSLSSDITRVVDSNLLTREEGNFDAKVQCILSIMKLSFNCTEEIPESRMSIKDVLMALNKIKLQFLASCGKI